MNSEKEASQFSSARSFQSLPEKILKRSFPHHPFALEYQWTSSQYLHLLLHLALLSTLLLDALLEVSPAPYPLVSRFLPFLLMVSFPLSFLKLFILFLLLPTFLLHLRLQLSSPPRLSLDQYLHRFSPPFLFELVSLQFRAVKRVLVLPNEQRAGIGYTFIKVLALWLIEQCGLGFLEAVEGFGRRWVFGLVRMDQKGFLAVLDLDVGVRDSWLEVKDGITEKIEG
jgi:hypothetical protein